MTAGAQLPLDFAYRPAMGQEDFLVAPCNEDAVAWVDAWPQWPASAVCIYGPAGCGKTHLANVWRARSNALVLSPRAMDGGAPADLLGDAQACVVEGAEAAHEQTLLHLFNLLVERRGHLLLTASLPPARWNVALPDLRSRLLAAPSAEIGPPDEGLIGAVMIKMFADRQIHIPHDVVIYLGMRIERSFDCVRRVVELMDRAALSAHRSLTVPLAREVLRRHNLDRGHEHDEN
jgi:chromosomal replication initiation ATPase DnaA